MLGHDKRVGGGHRGRMGTSGRDGDTRKAWASPRGRIRAQEETPEQTQGARAPAAGRDGDNGGAPLPPLPAGSPSGPGAQPGAPGRLPQSPRNPTLRTRGRVPPAAASAR